MPPPSRRTRPRLDQGIVSFEFQPSIGILARDMTTLSGNISTFRKPLEKAITSVMIPSFRQNFNAGGRPTWVPMAEATMVIRQDQGFGGAGNLLVRSGDLRRVMAQKSIWSVTDESATILDLPSSVWYGKVHQAGASGMGTRVKTQIKNAARKGKPISPGEAARRVNKQVDANIRAGKARGAGGAVNIPARPFVMFQEEDVDAVHEVFDKWLAQEMAKAGFIE